MQGERERERARERERERERDRGRERGILGLPHRLDDTEAPSAWQRGDLLL